MRFTHILVVFVALVVATACSYNDIDEVHSKPEHASQYLQVVGRVAQYSDCNVATRSKKEGDEPKVTSMGLALFPIENGTIGNCLYYDFKLGGSIVFVVDRHDAIFNSYIDKPFAMYIFANMQDAEGFPQKSDDGVGKSLEDFTKCAATANANVEDVPANGFPMMGSLGNTTDINGIEADGYTLILKPTAGVGNVDGLPLVNGSPTDNLEISLKSMYAKFTFTISVKSDQEIVGNKAPRFDLISYEVHNIAATVDANSSTNNDNAVIAESGSIGMGNYAQGATTAKFDFYLPERKLSPTKDIDAVLPTELKKKTYDKSVDDDQDGYRDEDEKYHQRFKNLLTEGQAATYVTITGKYTDHQEHIYDVDYKIYLGANNYDDFNIIRNTHYDNNITIRGIDDSNDQFAGGNYVSIDWRVNIERSTPLVIGLRRETLLDAHYEVRPLRLHLVGKNIPTGTSATVEILSEDGKSTIPTWIRLEKSDTTTDHITSGVSAGKRKYFTTDLVTSTLINNTIVTVYDLTGNTQAVWIYVDENTTTQSRTAIVRVTYDNSEPQDYKIVQEGLHAVTSTDGDRTYYIERYEEYLYNFDTADLYAQTKEEGMPWGLNGVQLSKEHKSFTNNTNNTSWNNYVNNNNTLPTYDFYIAKHDGNFAVIAGATMVHRYAGQHFTSEIFENSNGGVKKLTMDQQPSGAVEYCYNKNKRNSDGSIAKVEWYLPSADELEDFIVPAYASFKEFQDNYYWTSQPAYIRNVYYYEDGSNTFPFIVYDDNPEYARATKVVAKGNNVYEYALSGLNEKTNIIVDPSTGKILDFTGSGEINFGYFYLMYRWKSGTADETDGQNGFGGVVNGTQYKGEEFDEKLNGGKTGNRYHVHLGHLYDMTQEGYHLRTKSNRVRCVRKEYSADNEQTVLAYNVSTTPATSLDTSGNTLYVMKNTNNSTYLTTSGTNVAASSYTVSKDNLVIIQNNKIKSVAKNQYFYGYNGNVSFNNNGTSYTISNNGSNFTISYTYDSWYGSTTYYLIQTSDTAVSMSSGNNGNNTWQFYEVTIQ